MKKRLIVTGANGFVAGSVVHQAGEQWELHALTRKEIQFPRKDVVPHRVDLLDAERLREIFRQVRPDAVIHAAAAADIDFCETHKADAEAINVGVTREVARLCKELGAKMVHLSTDTVFDGKRGNYREDDPPSPINFYGETKVKAEQVVAAEAGNYAIVRLAIVMGLPFLGGGNSFMAKLVATLEAGREAGFPENEIRTPVDVITLGRALLELAGNDFIGIIHAAGNDKLTRFAIGRRIAERMGFNPELVMVKNSTEMPGRAPRPVDISLDNSKARAALKTPMQGLDGGIDLILEARKEAGL